MTDPDRRSALLPSLCLVVAVATASAGCATPSETGPPSARDGRAQDASVEQIEPPSADDPDLAALLRNFEASQPVPGDDEASDLASASSSTRAPGWRAWLAERVLMSGELELASTIRLSRPRESLVLSDYSALSRLRGVGRFTVDADLPMSAKLRVSTRAFRDYAYAIRSRHEFTSEVLDAYESDVDLGEAYVLIPLAERLDLKVGRQTMTWGVLDDFRVVDVFNPLDLREPGVIDLKDRRLPVMSTRLDYYLGPVQVTGIAVHESRLPDIPTFGSEFYPVDTPRRPEEVPSNGGNETEVGGRVFVSLGGIDLAAQVARFRDDDSYLDPRVGRLRHARLTMAGMSAAASLGSLVFRTDAAQITGLRFSARPSTQLRRTDVGLGIDYSGLERTIVSIEAVVRRLHDFDDAIRETRRTDVSTSLRLRRTFANERLVVTALLRAFGASFQDGSIARVNAEYRLSDAFRLGLGVLVFNGGERPPLSEFAENDSVFASIRYAF